MAVRGNNPAEFRRSLFELPHGGYHISKWPDKNFVPAILVTDTIPGPTSTPKALSEAKVIYFPLHEIWEQRGDLSGFLENLVETLRKPEAFEALEDLKPSLLQRLWGWVNKYVEMKPGWFGFKANIGVMIQDGLAKHHPA